MLSESGYFAALVWTHVWQIGVLGLAVGCVNAIVGRRWPHLAYALWLVVLVKCFLPPVGSWPLSVWGQWTPATVLGLPTAEPRDAVGWAESARPTTAAEPRESAGLVPPPIPLAAEESNAADVQARESVGLVPRPTLLLQAVPYVWLTGSVLLCGIAIGRGSEVGRRLRRTSRPVPDDVQAVVDRVAERLRLPNARVRRTSVDIGPVVAGISRPTVYLPDVLLSGTQPRQLEAMLMHELAHVRRCDTWVAATQFAAQTIWWFHPVVWWMNRELVRQRERCCDEEVVANLDGNRNDYARSLVGVLEARQRLEPLWGYPAVRPVELTRRRLEEIMKRKNMVHARAPRWCWLSAAMMALLVLPGAGPPAVADTQDKSSSIRVAQTTSRATTTTQAAARPPALLSYGDGKADGKKSYGGSGHLIRFELPEGVTKVRGLRIHGSRYGLPQAPDEDFEVTFLSEDREETLDSQAAPYRLFKRGKEGWVRVLFDKEIELSQKFWVALNFNAQQTKGVYVSYDTSTKGEYSRVGLPGDEEEPKETDFHGDWMVQVMLSRPEQ